MSVCSLIMPSHTSSALCWKKRNTFHYAYEALHKKSVHSCTLYLNAIGEIIFLKERKKNYIKTPCAGWCSYPLIQPGANGSIVCWVRACVCAQSERRACLCSNSGSIVCWVRVCVCAQSERRACLCSTLLRMAFIH